MNRSQAIAWLRNSPMSPKMFFDDASTGEWFAAAGSRSEFRVTDPTSISEIEHGLHTFAKKSGRVFGGVRFDTTTHASSEWRDFGTAFFFEPVETVCGVSSSNGSRAAVIGALAQPNPTQSWTSLFANAQSEIQSGGVQKLVLATRTEWGETVEPWETLPREDDSFTFCFEPTDGTLFFGVTPELLFRRSGSTVTCDALAGTRSRGDTAELDLDLARDLAESAKDAEEHDIVVRYLVDALENLGEVNSGSRTIRKLRALQHLHTPVSVVVEADHASVLSSIHPTPALSGFPSDRARDWLSQNEPFDRGWYGGSIGWVNGADACFAVAIRSALATPETTYVYAGAGIVASSDCEGEWREIQTKGRAIVDQFVATS